MEFTRYDLGSVLQKEQGVQAHRCLHDRQFAHHEGGKLIDAQTNLDALALLSLIWGMAATAFEGGAYLEFYPDRCNETLAEK